MTADATTIRPTPANAGDISALGVRLFCVALYLVLITLAFTAIDALGGELGVMEQTQNLVLAISLVLMLVLIVRADTRNLRLWAVFIAFGTFYLLGEEMSWGQHYFGWATTGVFADINDQNETNIHNTAGGWFDQKPRAILLFGMILGTIVHPLVKWARKGRGLFDNPWWLAPTLASLPPVVFSQIGALPERIDDLGLFAFSAQAFTNNYRSSEMEEVFMYLFFVTYTLSLLARLAHRKRQGVGA